MAFSHKITETHSTNEGVIASRTVTVTDEAEVGYDDVVAPGAVDVAANVAFPFAGIKALCLVSDKAVTIKTNDAGTPGNTIALAAGVPLIWYVGARGANPFTADVTELFLSNAGGVAANVKIRVLVHVTA